MSPKNYRTLLTLDLQEISVLITKGNLSVEFILGKSDTNIHPGLV